MVLAGRRHRLDAIFDILCQCERGPEQSLCHMNDKDFIMENS